MDLKECAVIPLNMHILYLRKYNTMVGTNTFLLKNNIRPDARKMSGKF